MSDYILEGVSVRAQKVDGGRWTRMRCRSVCLGCAIVVTAAERRPDGRMLLCVNSLDAWFWFSVRIRTVKAWPIDAFARWEFQSRGVRKVATGITGLWQTSVHSDVAFWSFDVGSSYHCEAEYTKRWIVQPPIGNVSWI